MITINLSDEEQEILSQILQHSLATIEVEIHHTDHQDFKVMLKHRRTVLESLNAKLPAQAPASA
jgi:hypothetical protein